MYLNSSRHLGLTPGKSRCWGTNIHVTCNPNRFRVKPQVPIIDSPWIRKTETVHPGRLTWNLRITHFERKIIFQTYMIMFHVNLQGCSGKRIHFCGSSSSSGRVISTYFAGFHRKLLNANNTNNTMGTAQRSFCTEQVSFSCGVTLGPKTLL